MNAELLFRNQVLLGGFLHPFVDRAARFGVTFDPGRGLGPCMLQARSCDGAVQPVDLALNLHLGEDDQLFPLTAGATEHLPWCVTQEAAAGEVALTARHTYLDAGALLCAFTFTNRGTEAADLSPCWTGLAPGDRWPPSDRQLARFGQARSPLRRNRAAWRAGALTVGLSTGELPAPQARLRWCPADGLSLAVGAKLPANLAEGPASGEVDVAGALHWRLRAPPLHLAAGATRTFVFTIAVRVVPAGAAEAPWSEADPAALDPAGVEAQAQRDFLNRVGWAGQAGGARQRRAWRARWSLLRTAYQGDGAGELGHLTASTCVPNGSGFTRIFFWDSLFTAAALTRFNPALARDAIRAVFVRQDRETGFCPEHVFDRPLKGRDAIGEAQAPVAAWAVARHLAAHPDDEAFLAEMYPVLVINHRHWQERGDRDRDGLAEWTWCGQTADDSPLYDEFAVGREKVHGWLPPVASVSLNSFLFRDAILLAGFAGRLGRSAEAEAWRARAAAIEEAFLRICHLPGERRFWDYNHATRRHTRVKTFYQFWPLWAGMNVPAATREALLDMLLDPAQFYGEVPFPSVAYDEPTYDPTGYWRGKAWPHISYWLLEMLQQHRPQAAGEARRRVLAAWLKDPYHPENMTTDAGRSEASGSPDYNWGAALLSLLLEEPR